MLDDTPTRIEVERRGADAALVTLIGQVTEPSVRDIERKLLDLCEQGVTRIAVSLAGVPFMSSAGIGVLMVAWRELRSRNGALSLVAPQPLVRQVIETMKLTKLFPIHNSADDALAGP